MKKHLANTEFRQEMKRLGVPMWALADKQGLCELTVSRKLRHELPDEEKAELLELVHQIATERCAYDE